MGKNGGFTIIEVMIFLTVSAFMFASAIGIFRGQQQATQFSQSIRQFDSNLSDVINDTVTGVFPELPDVECAYAGASLSFSSQRGSNTGENNSCIFLGKVIQFGDGAYADGPDEDYRLHTLIGSNDEETDTFAGAYPSALFNASGSGPTFNTKESFQLQWGTKIKKAYYVDNLGNTHYVRGAGVLYSRFGQVNTADGRSFVSGAASVSLYAVKALNSASLSTANSRLTDDQFQGSISTGNNGGLERSEFELLSAESTTPIIICMEGSGGRTAFIELGSQQGSITTNTSFENNQECDA